MESTLINHPVYIEFLGTPGSGKTTLLASLASFLKERHYQPYTVVEAARPIASRTWQGKLIHHLFPGSLQTPLLWQVFSFNSTLSRHKFIHANKELIRQVNWYQKQRLDQSAEHERGILHWFYRLTGYYEFLRPRMKNSEILILDDGFVHRVVHLFASEVETPDPKLISSYLELIPKPDLVIIPSSPLDVCEKRVYQRGLWKHSQHKTPQQIKQFLSHAEQVVQITTAFLLKQGWPVIILDNGYRSPDKVTADLFDQLEKLGYYQINNHQRKENSPNNTTRQPVCLPRPSRLLGILRSKQRSLDIDLITIEHVLKSYGFSIQGQPQNLPLSKRTQNILLPTQSGKKVLKRYRPKLPVETIEYSHSILEELEKINYPSIRLEENLQGMTIIEQAGFHYSISTFVEGISYSSSFLLREQRKHIMAIAGRNLAQFHRSLRNFVPSGNHHLGFSTITGEWQRGVDWYTEKCLQMKTESDKPMYDHDRKYLDWMAQNFDHILKDMRDLDRLLFQASLPRLIIHGDYGLHNLVFPEDGQVTMLDFETARLEWRLSDLVSACSRLRFRDGSYDLDMISSFLTAYMEEYAIDLDEWQWLPGVWRFYKLRSALIYWNSYLDTKGPSRKLISARDAVWQANWAVQNIEQLLNLNPEYREKK